MQVASTPSNVSVIFPVGSSFPVLEPLQHDVSLVEKFGRRGWSGEGRTLD